MWLDWLVFCDYGFSVSALWCLLQHLPSYLGFSYLGHGVSLHSCSSKVQLLLVTLNEGYLLTTASPDLERGRAPLGPPVPMQPLLLGGWNSSWAISNPERWCCESIVLNMPANLEKSAVTTGLEKISFHFNPKERPCQKMLKLLHNSTHLNVITQQSNAQNSPSQSSAVCEPWTSRCSSWF